MYPYPKASSPTPPYASSCFFYNIANPPPHSLKSLGCTVKWHYNGVIGKCIVEDGNDLQGWMFKARRRG